MQMIDTILLYKMFNMLCKYQQRIFLNSNKQMLGESLEMTGFNHLTYR